MKICLVANPNSAHTRRLAEGLIERRHQVYLICQSVPKSPLPAGVQVIELAKRFNIPKLRYLAWSLIMPGMVKQIKPDILHAISASGAAWLAAAALFRPLVVTATGSDLLLLRQRSWLHNQLTYFALHQADRVLCLSSQLAQVARDLGISKDRIEVNFFGIDLRTFSPSDRVDSGNQEDQTESVRVLSLRAMKRIYNPADIARAVPLVLQKAPQVHFLIMTYNADPLVQAEFEAIIVNSGASHAVEYLPPLSSDEAIAGVLRQSDIAVSVAASDGTPVSVLESMACGCALVLGEIPALKEWAIPEQNSLLVPLGSTELLSQAIVRLIVDVPLRRRLAVSALETVREKGGRESQFDQLEEIYQNLIMVQV